jgi:hypothetical protein
MHGLIEQQFPQFLAQRGTAGLASDMYNHPRWRKAFRPATQHGYFAGTVDAFKVMNLPFTSPPL